MKPTPVSGTKIRLLSARSLTFAVASSVAILGPAGSATAEICHAYDGGQYAKTRTCVTSVLSPQGRNTYGPGRMSAESDDRGAWCEGATGPGIGQVITLHQSPTQKIGSLIVVNGYAKTPQTFRANGRVKRVQIQTSGGHTTTATLKDTSNTEVIKIPAAEVSWVRLTILEVYPGNRHSDTCISKLYFDHEEFGALEEPETSK